MVATRMASFLWSTASASARWLAQQDILPRISLGCRVISIGNLQAGGSGKTPLVAFVANQAHEQGLRTCILSRGYRGGWESRGGMIHPGDSVRAADCGDEPALLHELCPHSHIGVGADRAQQFLALAKIPTQIDLVILDDGFQHWKIKKDLEIVVLTDAEPEQTLHRDFRSALKFADLIVTTKGATISTAKPFVQFEQSLSGPSDPSQKYWLVTGIADGSSARAMIERSGYQIIHHDCLKDHEQYTEDSVRNYLEAAQKKSLKIALTGKDWVKWKDCGVSKNEVEVLEPQLKLKKGAHEWARVLWGK